MRFLHQAAGALAAAQLASGIPLDIDDPNSILSAAKTIAQGLTSYYYGWQVGNTPGYLPGPYYWWECGAMFNTLIDYWYYTGDTSYNAWVIQGLQHQSSPTQNFMPSNATKSEGNDDQYFWGAAVMTAAELGFQNPPDGDPGWLALAQGVFNSQAARWDAGDCGGGLRWQIFTFNTGYNYKNTAANGGLFNLAARLGAYTGNQTYFDWADKLWDWMYDTVHLIDNQNYNVYDGTSIENNCTTLDHTMWTYTGGMMINSAAVMYNATGSDVWANRTQGLWTAASKNYFNQDKVMFEVCEATVKCDTDQQSFKAYLARFMAASSKLAPFLYDQMLPYLQASAIAAAQQCDGGTNGTQCGLRWTLGTQYDGLTGAGEEMAALEVVQSLLIKNSAAPVTATTGGTSVGDASAGTGSADDTTLPSAITGKITTADRAGAGILSALVIGGTLGGAWFVIS